eukprot:TRINITY_DN17311_c0_g1_i1.p1 TRINITY_DN17311_c0_g1~~TRINITY_DN17311_c0_g1_i1.p1  ORF type:complete len:511 (-),score=68.87 TRINITY_DN17311_c0_g1_i1:13-1545(-)
MRLLLLCLWLGAPLLLATPVDPTVLALRYLGSSCNTVTANGCNPYQLPPFIQQPFVPSLLIKATQQDVFIDPTQRIDAETTVSISKTVAQEQSRVVQGFNLQLPLPQAAFSLGIAHQSLVSTMSYQSTTNFFSQSYRSYVTFSAALTNPTPTLTPGFAAAVQDLPNNATSLEALQLWFNFFARFGTHYVRTITYGGTVRTEVYLSASVEQDSTVQESDWTTCFQATFAQNSGVNFSFPTDHSQQAFQSFQKYLENQKYFSAGGDESLQNNYTLWLESVKQNPAPVITMLAPLSDFLPLNKPFDQAYNAYTLACPRTANGICNSFGSCDWMQGSCACLGDSYKNDTDGNCYPNCDCRNNGTCSNGVCICPVGKRGVGFDGPRCDIPCGTAQYRGSTDECYAQIDSNVAASMCTSSDSSCDYPDQEAGNCWCQGALRGYNVTATRMLTTQVDTTAWCGGGGCDHFLALCGCLANIDCVHGDGHQCSGPSFLLDEPVRPLKLAKTNQTTRVVP